MDELRENPSEIIASADYQTVNAVGNAVMLSWYNLLREKAVEQRKPLTKITEQSLQNITANECQNASRRVCHHLITRTKDKFDKVFMVKAVDPSKTMKNFDNYHFVFVAQGRNKKWYAGSPANYKPDSPRNYLNTIIETDNLKDLLTKLREEEGGDWPTESKINQANLGFDHKSESIGGEDVETVEVTSIEVNKPALREKYYYRPNGMFNFR